MKFEMPTEPFERLRYDLRHGTGAPSFDWSVEFGDDAAIARAWRGEKNLYVVTAEDVLVLLRGWFGGVWVAAGVATDAAKRIRKPWATEMAAVVLRAAEGLSPLPMPSVSLKSYDAYSVRALLNAASYASWGGARTDDMMRTLPLWSDMHKTVGKWLAKHAPPPTWAEIHAYVARRAASRAAR